MSTEPMTTNATATIDPITLSRLLGQKFDPTKQQAQVIGAPLKSALVVAGAGAGKTETMAARVVWLVANNLVEPDEVLGLTFTRKAAMQLSRRIRKRLAQLAEKLADKQNLIGLGLREDQEQLLDLVKPKLEAVAPTISTYDAFAGKIVQEFGLLAPVEPRSRLISATELYQIVHKIVSDYHDPLSTSSSPVESKSVDGVVEDVLDLITNIDNHVVSYEDIVAETKAFVENVNELVESTGKEAPQYANKWLDTAQYRIDLIGVVKKVDEYLEANHLMTFGRKMAIAANLATDHYDQVAGAMQKRFSVVLLDEYQDTSHAQRVLLKNLFNSVPTTAVGDPMQSIYGWRGATAANLARFQSDFKDGDQEAAKYELTQSFRNPPAILNGANLVSDALFDELEKSKRPVAPLESMGNSIQEEVQFAHFEQPELERIWVAEELAKAYKATADGARKETEPFAAVLVRKKRHLAPMALELQSRGVPVQIVGLGGLLDIPEVADLVAVAEMLVHPQRNKPALRILTGPQVQLSASDLMILSKRARNLAGRGEERKETSKDPEQRLAEKIEEVLNSKPEAAVGLADAVADLGEPDRFSKEGYARLSELAARLRHLRTYSLGGSLTDLFADIENVMNIRTEVLARRNPTAGGASGTVHLDRFAAEVERLSTIPGMDLPTLLDYFELARSKDGGFEPGEVQVEPNCVQLMTVHASKGLEWPIVSVLHASEKNYLSRGTSTWITKASELPVALRGDFSEQGEAEQNNSDGPQNLRLPESGKLSDFKKIVEGEHKDSFAKLESAEATRLFYVAITRASERLLVTSSDNPHLTKGDVPYERFQLLLDKFPEFIVPPEDQGLEEVRESLGILDQEDQTEEGERAVIEAHAAPEELFPQEYQINGVDEVQRAIEQLPPLSSDGGIYDFWEQEVSALIEEHVAAQTPVVEVPIGHEFTATDLVALKSNPEQFARRLKRPIPFKPNVYAKRGTEFHEWLEQRFEANPIFDPWDLQGLEEPEADFELLKERFLQSQWAERTPAYVEQAFEVALGDKMLRGRMDAVFELPDGTWLVVDWKTGQPPRKKDEKDAVALQLAVYRYAFAKLRGIDLEKEPEKVRAAFYYIRFDETVEPPHLLTEAELVALTKA